MVERTPNGGAYSVSHFFHDGMPVPERFANYALVVEFDAAETEVARSLVHLTANEVLPLFFEPDPQAARPPGEGVDLLSFRAALGRIRPKPRTRPVTEGPPLAT